MDFSKFKQKINLSTGIFLIFLSAICLSYFRVLDNYELETLDIRFRLRPQLPFDKNIAIIEVGDDTVDKLGIWPIPRRYHAILVDALTEAGAEVIFFDVFFSEKSEENSDMLFQEAIKKSGRVYLPHAFDTPRISNRDVPVSDRLQEELLDRFASSTKGTGFVNILPDTDGKFRRVPPFIKYKNTLYPHLCLVLAADYVGIKKDDIKITPGKLATLGDRIRIPLDQNSTILVNFPGRWEKTFKHYSYIDIIDTYISSKFPDITKRRPVVDLADFKGSVCFIGVTATATPDAHPSPFSPLHPGVGVNASLFNSLLIEKFTQRAGRLTNTIILLFLCSITYLIAKRTRTLLGFLFIFLFILAYVILATVIFFVWGLWLDIFTSVTIVLLFYLGATFAKYIGETHKREILEKELSIAKNIQQSFLPKESPDVAGLDIAAKMVTARQVGGDLYDFIAMGPKRVGIMIGDVSGKGVPAALYMAKVVSEFKSYAEGELVSRAIGSLNERLVRESGSGLFVTLSYIIFDMEQGFLNYSSGGHLPMIIAKEGTPEVRLVDLKEGMPLGLFEGNFCEEKIKFEKGDIFLLYTDGVTEAMNPRDEMFGQERLVDLVKNNTNLNAEGLVNLIQGEVNKFEGKKRQHDDITVIAVRIV